MKVVLEPKFYGYCPGLKRSLKVAAETIEEAKAEGKKIFYDVPLAHNEIVAESLKAGGFQEIELTEDKDGGNNIFMVSAHGASLDKIKWLRSHNFEVRSGTCPTVRRVQDQAVLDYKNGFQIVIFGKKDHAEVVGVNGCVDNSAIVVKIAEEAKNIKLNSKTSVLCQTTFPAQEFKRFVEYLIKANPNTEITVHDTICPIVESRIKTIIDYIKTNKIDRAVVVGSKTSSNTKQLADLLGKTLPTIMVGDETEIETTLFSPVDTVLVVSGTSAPPEIVEKVAKKLQSL